MSEININLVIAVFCCLYYSFTLFFFFDKIITHTFIIFSLSLCVHDNTIHKQFFFIHTSSSYLNYLCAYSEEEVGTTTKINTKIYLYVLFNKLEKMSSFSNLIIVVNNNNF